MVWVGRGRKTIISHFMFSWCFMQFPTFLEKNIFGAGGGGVVSGDLG